MAERFSQPDVPTSVRAIVTPTAPAPFTPLALSMEPLPTRPKLAPLSPGRYEWRLTVSQSVQDKLDEARALLGHAVPSGDLAQVLERALCVRQRQRQALRGSQGSPVRSRPPVAKGGEGDGGEGETAVPRT